MPFFDRRSEYSYSLRQEEELRLMWMEEQLGCR